MTVSGAQDPAPVEPAAASGIDATTPHSARIWNYWLGGNDNYAVDREAGDQYLEVFPGIREIAQHNRTFLARAVKYLADEAGIDQFLDIGTGLPTAENTHQVAHRHNPDARVVYVDNDPLVLSHARALLTSTPPAPTTFVDADLHEPDDVLRQAANTLDLTRPVAVMLVGTIGHATSTTAHFLVRRLLNGVVSGSYLALDQATNTDPEWARAQDAYNASGATPYYMYTPEQIAELFTGLELVEPGLASCPEWHPHTPARTRPDEATTLAAVARKP